MPVLTEQQLAESLKSLQGWSGTAKQLKRSFEFKDFAGAMAFVNHVAAAAEQMDHHPDIDIRYNKVTMALSSHDSGGVTQRDLTLAGKISSLAE